MSEGVSREKTDGISRRSGGRPALEPDSPSPPQETTGRVLSILGATAAHGLIKSGPALTTLVRPAESNALRRVSGQLAAISRDLIDLMREEAPDCTPFILTLNACIQRLRDLGRAEAEPEAARETFYEALVQMRRERPPVGGLFVGTLHGAKGMEFRHVVILDGGWNRSKGDASQEEERRLFYVGMTRARETPCLVRRADVRNPHLPLLDGLDLDRATAGGDGRAEQALLNRSRGDDVVPLGAVGGTGPRSGRGAPIPVRRVGGMARQASRGQLGGSHHRSVDESRALRRAQAQTPKSRRSLWERRLFVVFAKTCASDGVRFGLSGRVGLACAVVTWRRPTLPRLETQYHRR